MITMKTTLFASAVMSVGLFAMPAIAQSHDGHDHGQGEAMKPMKPMTMHAPANDEAIKPGSGPYTLNTCPVSGEELGGEMGDPIVKVYDGREVRFCCNGCIKDFEADKAGFFKKIDKQIIADQLRYYPDVCIVSGEPLTEGGEDIAINYVYGNRLLRFCCMDCKKEFKADPAAYIEKLDKIVADAQREDYPLDTCPVTGEAVGSMAMDDQPAEAVIAGRLVRFCCPGCEPKVRANPAAFLAKVDKAWQAKGMYLPAAETAQAEHGGMQHMDGVDADHGMSMDGDHKMMNNKHGEHGGHGDHDDHGDHDH